MRTNKIDIEKYMITHLGVSIIEPNTNYSNLYRIIINDLKYYLEQKNPIEIYCGDLDDTCLKFFEDLIETLINTFNNDELNRIKFTQSETVKI